MDAATQRKTHGQKERKLRPKHESKGSCGVLADSMLHDESATGMVKERRGEPSTTTNRRNDRVPTSPLCDFNGCVCSLTFGHQLVTIVRVVVVTVSVYE